MRTLYDRTQAVFIQNLLMINEIILKSLWMLIEVCGKFIKNDESLWECWCNAGLYGTFFKQSLQIGVIKVHIQKSIRSSLYPFQNMWIGFHIRHYVNLPLIFQNVMDTSRSLTLRRENNLKKHRLWSRWWHSWVHAICMR